MADHEGLITGGEVRCGRISQDQNIEGQNVLQNKQQRREALILKDLEQPVDGFGLWVTVSIVAKDCTR